MIMIIMQMIQCQFDSFYTGIKFLIIPIFSFLHFI